MNCPSCNTENRAGRKFCAACGAPLAVACTACGTPNEPGEKFCGECGAALVSSSEFRVPSSPRFPASQTPNPELRTSQPPSAERRQLTVMFCDLVGSTALSARLDPEDLREIVRHYQQTCAEVIHRHEGYIAQYLGDGLLVYLGYPTAHEDDARRAVRAGLEILAAIKEKVPSPLVGEGQGEGAPGKPLPVRIGIHTGLVVIGEIGASGRTEQLALGETPNLAARIQGLAEPNTVVVSAATQRLVEGQFECQSFGSHLVKGIETPIAVYHVRSERQTGGQLENKATLAPLVGRDQEVGLLFDRWEQVKEGRGQVVLLSGEPGIGKSRLASMPRERVTSEGSLLHEARCSPYHQHSALYPLIEVFQRMLLLTRQDTDSEKIEKLERALALDNMHESLPLFTALLSLPTPSQYPPLNLTPRKQKERTLQVLLRVLVAQAERQATVFVWEDLHWADPSSLEFLTLFIDQIPTTKLLLVLTFRPEFISPWKLHSHITQLTLNRLGKKHVETMIEKAAAGSHLPAEIIEQIRIKTDGVPLFVEELTKSVIEARGQVTGDRGRDGKPVGVLAIPATLQETLLARLDRLSTARQIAQLGATLGREFSYELLRAVAPTSEADLQSALSKLVEAEILCQRGVGEQARYFFKHALIQDTAYQSLLKSTRQQYHQQIAQILEERFPDTKANQTELLAHHYTEAGLKEQAIPYWQQAGQRASQRSAHVEAISHLNKGLDLLKTLPDTPERNQQEITLQITLGASLIAIKGYTVPEVEKAYTRAMELCRRVGETPQLFPVLMGLYRFYAARADHETAHELAKQLLALAQKAQDPALLLGAHYVMGGLYWLGEFVPALAHQQQAIALYHPQQHRPLAFVYGVDFGIVFSAMAFTLWSLGYAEQALKSSDKAITLTQELSHPHSLAAVLHYAAWLHQYRRDGLATQKRAGEVIALSHEQGFPFLGAWGTMYQGWALTQQGQEEEGLALIRQGLAASQATGAGVGLPYWLALLAELYGKAERVEEGLTLLAEALTVVDKTGERFYEAEVYRLKGTLTLQKFQVSSFEFQVPPSPQPLAPNTQAAVQEAEGYFLKAIDIAQKQQAKSLELRAATSLARLWRQQGKMAEAHKLLSEVYNWFTEGFDTKDLQEAQALIENLRH